MKKRCLFGAMAIVLGSVLVLSSCRHSPEEPVGPEGFVRVDGGTYDGLTVLTPESGVFIAGRTVTIPNLYVCPHEVTQSEYETYCEYNGTSHSSGGIQMPLHPDGNHGAGENYPVYYVNWYDAIAYCNSRSIAEGRTPCYSLDGDTDYTHWAGGYIPSTQNTSADIWNTVQCDFNANGYRLPTEAEWEYLARGGNRDSFLYSGSDTLNDVAWNWRISDIKSHEVMTKAPNSLGLYDMSGNVREWCWTQGSAETKRIVRGGSFNENIENVYKVSDSEEYTSYTRTVILGFSVVCTAD